MKSIIDEMSVGATHQGYGSVPVRWAASPNRSSGAAGESVLDSLSPERGGQCAAGCAS